MINVSSAFRQALLNDNRQYIERAVINLESGTTLTLTNENLWGGGFTIEDAVSDDNSFSALGSAVVNSATLVINNIYDDFSDYVFENARVIMSVGLQLESGIEYVRKGTYIVDEARYNGSIITLSLLDYMYFFDKPYSESTLVYPASADTIIRNACVDCLGVTPSTLVFPNQNITFPERPTDEAITYREVVAYVAQICGCYARCNANGNLELKWFDQSSLEQESANVYHIDSVYKSDVAMDDVVITDVQATYNVTIDDKEETLKYPQTATAGYVIGIEKNPFITGLNVQDIVNGLKLQLAGLSFRKANITHSSDPTLEAGDVAILDDQKGNSYHILVTRTNFKVGASQTTVCGAETQRRNSVSRYTEETKNYVEMRKKLIEQKDAFERALEDLSERIDDAEGMFTTEVQTASGGTITYLHNKPELSESDIQIMISSVGVTVTSNGTDPNPTWYGLTVDGTLISNILNTVGINAHWINTGQLVITKNGVETFFADVDTGTVRISGNSISISSGDPISTAVSTAEQNAKNYADQQAASASGYTLETSFSWNSANTIATFTATIYKGKENITSELSDEYFFWTLRTEDGESRIGTGKTCTVSKSLFGYGSTITCEFNLPDATAALRSVSGARLKSVDNKQMLLYAGQDTDIIVSQLPVKLSYQVALADTLMGIDSTEGFQISLNELSDVVLKRVTNTINGETQTVISAIEALDTEIAGAKEEYQYAFEELQETVVEAQESADAAQLAADTAKEAADSAIADATIARDSAVLATQSANGAVAQLAEVENVLDTLSWIAEHAVYSETSDTVFEDGKNYFRLIPVYTITSDTEIEDKEYYTLTGTLVENPVSADISLYYVLDNGVYVQASGSVDTSFYYDYAPNTDGDHVVQGHVYYTLEGTEVDEPDESYLKDYYEQTEIDGVTVFQKSTDDEIDPEKTYYTVIAEEVEDPVDSEITSYYLAKYNTSYYTVVGTLVSNPDAEYLSEYYERYDTYGVYPYERTGDPSALNLYELYGYDETITNYISTHLALLDDGLYVTLDDSGYKLKLTNTGAYIVDDTGAVVATYSNKTIIGNEELRNVYIDDDSIDIRDGDKVLASFGEKSVIGDENAARMELSSGGFDVWGSPDEEVLHLGITSSNPSSKTTVLVHSIEYSQGDSYLLFSTPNAVKDSSIKIFIDCYIDENHVTKNETFTQEELGTSRRFWVYKQYYVEITLTRRSNGYQLKIDNQHQNAMTGTMISVTYTAQALESARFSYGKLRDSAEYPLGEFSFSSGYLSAATGQYATALGDESIASGESSFSVGHSSQAFQKASAAIGANNRADGEYSVAMGQYGITTGINSFALGYHTSATAAYQTVIGCFNELDPLSPGAYESNVRQRRTYAFIIGNGTAVNARSNAFTVDWNGNVDIPAGADFRINGVGLLASIPTNVSDLANDSGFITANDIKFDEYVSKSGDTMTGNLFVQTDSNPSYNLKNDAVSGRVDAETLSANTAIGSMYTRDANNEVVFYCQTYRTTGNRTYQSFIHRRYSADGSSSKTHGFYLAIENDNSLLVTFPSTTSRAAWVDGLFKSDNVTSNTAPSANSWANAPLIFRDKNDTEIGRAGVYFTPDGLQYASLRTTRNINGSNVYNELGLRIAADGTRSILISDGAAWRNALGINNTVSVKITESVSVASATAWASGTTLCNSDSLSAGTYIVMGYVSFQSNATGRRYTAVMTSDTGTSGTHGMYDSRMAVNGGATAVNIFGVMTLTAATTLYLRVLQNSGSALSCNGRLEVLKIH